MPKYTYRARREDGTLTEGSLRAADEERAGSLLRSHQLTPVSLKSAEAVPIWQRQFFGGINIKDLILFSRQMASMIRAGVPILEALRSLARQITKHKYRQVLTEMAYDIEAGESLSNTMSKHPSAFNPFILGIVRTGEASGRLTEALDAISDYLEQDYAFRSRVRSALIYPIFLLSIVVIISFVMFTFVLPQLVTIFQDAGVALPLPTRILIGLTGFFSSYWIFILVFIAILSAILYSYLRTPEGRYTLSSVALGIPFLRKFFERLYLSRLTSILRTLFSSDVPALESLTLAKEAVSNRVYRRILEDTIEAVKDGAAISQVWQHEPNIPPMLTSMVAVGERSGNVSDSFKEASRFFKRDVDNILDAITVLLEPILIVVLGAGVGVVVAAVLLPIYNLVLVL